MPAEADATVAAVPRRGAATEVGDAVGQSVPAPADAEARG